MIAVDFGPARLSLLPGRAVYWPAQSALLIADTHFGKASVFRRQGLAVPDGDTPRDMDRIRHLAEEYRARRLIILGDIVHGAVDQSLDTQLAQWMTALAEADVQVTLVVGNHDRDLMGGTHRWGAEVVSSLSLDGLKLTHDAPEQPRDWTLGGHIHPVLSIGGRGPDRLRMPAFWQRQRRLVLPSFGQFTGGQAIKPMRDDRFWLAGDDDVIAF